MHCGSEVIMDNIMLFELLLALIVDYFQVVLEILSHYCATVL